MEINEEDDTSPTTAKTLWTESILEVLYLALKYDKTDEDIRKMLKLMTGCKRDYIIQKVDQKLGKDAASRVRILMHK
jgi:nickel-dependent lactate racemase